jgi:hypothetical protein
MSFPSQRVANTNNLDESLISALGFRLKLEDLVKLVYPSNSQVFTFTAAEMIPGILTSGGECYVSMKSFSKSRVSLDIPSINVRLILPQLFMSHVKNRLAALAVLVGIELLSLGLFTSETSWSNQHTLAGAQSDGGSVKLGSPAKTDDGFVFGSYGEPTPRSGVFLTAKEKPGIFVRSFGVSPPLFQIILAPKVSRYISKSVLNL